MTKTFESIMADMMSRLPSDLDTREGSLIYTALAPMAAQLAELYFYVGNLLDTTMPDTARGDDLTRVCAAMGVNRMPATAAVRRGIFVSNGAAAIVPLGTRWQGGNHVFMVQEMLEPGAYAMHCQQAGQIGNVYFGQLLPIDHVADISSATLTDVLIPGFSGETDDALRARYYATVNAQPFGGNIAQYEQELRKIHGVGGVRVFPTPNGQGGKVQCVICDASMRPATPTLVAQVQEVVHPLPAGTGLGLAPIGHDVTISTVVEAPVSVRATVLLAPGGTLAAAEAQARDKIAAYLASISFVQSVVRSSWVESLLLNLDAVLDVQNTTLNGVAQNVVLAARWDHFEVPVLGIVQLTEG